MLRKTLPRSKRSWTCNAPKRRRRLNLARKVNSAVVLHFKANTKAYWLDTRLWGCILGLEGLFSLCFATVKPQARGNALFILGSFKHSNQFGYCQKSRGRAARVLRWQRYERPWDKIIDPWKVGISINYGCPLADCANTSKLTQFMSWPTNHALKQVLQCPKHFGRLSKWAIELSEFDIEFKPRTAMKG